MITDSPTSDVFTCSLVNKQVQNKSLDRSDYDKVKCILKNPTRFEDDPINDSDIFLY